MSYLLPYWRRYRVMFCFGVLLVSAEAACELMLPRIMASLIDEGALAGSLPTVARYAAVMVAVLAFSACVALGRNFTAATVSQRFARDLRADLFTKIQHLSADGIDSFEGGSLITRMVNDVSQMQTFTAGMMRMFMKSPLLCIGAIAMSASLSPRTLLVVVPIVLVVFSIIAISMGLAYPRFARMQAALDRMNTTLREYLAGIRLVKAFRRFDYEEQRFATANDHLTDETINANRVLAVFSPFVALTVSAGVVGVLLLSPGWVASEELRVGQIMALISYLAQMLQSLNMISNLLNVFVRVRASNQRIAEVFATEPERDGLFADKRGLVVAEPTAAVGATAAELTAPAPSDTPSIDDPTAHGDRAHGDSPFGFCSTKPKRTVPVSSVPVSSAAPTAAAPLPSSRSRFNQLTLRDVGFSYRGSSGEPALAGISFTLARGQTLGVIGPTGSGKSSLASLLMRFYEPTTGLITLNGKPISDLPEQELRSFVAIVPQAPAMFSGTIRDNLLWGKDDASDDELREAAQAAQALQFIDDSPEGFDRFIGQGGVNLSGGQKQRLSIARALLRQPELLILDDCTSALDMVTEQLVMQALLSSGLATVLISQRIATVSRCDQVLVLEAGRQVGLGHHSELLESCEVYREIYDSQIGGLGAGQENAPAATTPQTSGLEPRASAPRSQPPRSHKGGAND